MLARGVTGRKGQRTAAQRPASPARTFTTAAASQPKKLLLMDANGVSTFYRLVGVYHRVTKKMAGLQNFLVSTNKYDASLFKTFGEDEATTADLKKLKVQANKGEVTSEQYYRRVISELRILPEHHAKAVEALHEAEQDIRLFDGILPSLKLLMSRGVKLGMITDSMSTTAQKEGWIRRQGLDPKWFDIIVNSSAMGVTKPHSKMYLAALNHTGVPAELTAFIGHKKAELDGAADLKIATITFNPDKDLVPHLKNYNYNVSHWKEIPALPIFPQN